MESWQKWSFPFSPLRQDSGAAGGGGLECAAEQAGGAGHLESQGPPVLATGADLGEFHLAPQLAAQPPLYHPAPAGLTSNSVRVRPGSCSTCHKRKCTRTRGITGNRRPDQPNASPRIRVCQGLPGAQARLRPYLAPP
jgi:hypothetical protein